MLRRVVSAGVCLVVGPRRQNRIEGTNGLLPALYVYSRTTNPQDCRCGTSWARGSRRDLAAGEACSGCLDARTSRVFLSPSAEGCFRCQITRSRREETGTIELTTARYTSAESRKAASDAISRVGGGGVGVGSWPQIRLVSSKIAVRLGGDKALQTSKAGKIAEAGSGFQGARVAGLAATTNTRTGRPPR